jgi:hypothetical protein
MVAASPGTGSRTRRGSSDWATGGIRTRQRPALLSCEADYASPVFHTELLFVEMSRRGGLKNPPLCNIVSYANHELC